MRVLFIFLDGVGLGEDTPQVNPLAQANMPALQELLGGSRLLRSTTPYEGRQASLLALDANLGVSGPPQSATGQAALLTGRSVSAEIGYHYGPKPNPEVAGFLDDGTVFKLAQENGLRAALLNAYPPRYFEAIDSGRRLYSAIPLAAFNAGVKLRTEADYRSGQALSADLTGHGWREHLGLTGTPLYTPGEAGRRLAELARVCDFAFFEYWLSDYAGHGQDMQPALELLATLDGVFAGLAESWRAEDGLVLVTSDHGNLEDLSTRRHTLNPVPCLLLGGLEQRRRFAAGLADIAGLGQRVKEAILWTED